LDPSGLAKAFTAALTFDSADSVFVNPQHITARADDTSVPQGFPGTGAVQAADVSGVHGCGDHLVDWGIGL